MLEGEKPKPYQITFEWDDNDFYQEAYQTISRLPTPDVLAEKSEIALRATMAAIQDVGERIATTMNTLSYPPEGAELEFGICLGADSGVFTKDNSRAHFVVKLIWRHKPKPPNGDRERRPD